MHGHNSFCCKVKQFFFSPNMRLQNLPSDRGGRTGRASLQTALPLWQSPLQGHYSFKKIAQSFSMSHKIFLHYPEWHGIHNLFTNNSQIIRKLYSLSKDRKNSDEK